ncbi:hypothetical protein DBV15_11251, partial [Temnothorax longispinosus]
MALKLPWALLYEASVISSSSIEKRFIGWENFLFTDRLFRQWLYSDWIFSLTSKGKEQKKMLKILHGFTKRNYYNTKKLQLRRKRLAMLDLLIAASRDGLMTDSDIREEVDTFMFEDRVRNEVNTALQKNEQKFTMKLLQDLPYLDRCIKEALRLYPSVFAISRIAGEDVKLQSYLVPAGTLLHLNIYGVHRDPNFWSNPEVFDPDRFLPEKIRHRHPYSYLPFSAGPQEQWKLLCTKTDEFYPITKIWLIFFPAISIRHPNDLETILSSTKHIEKTLIYDNLQPWFGTGLLTSGVMRQWLHIDWIFSLTSKGREQKKVLKILHGFTKQIIAERKLYHNRTNGQYLKSFYNDTSANRDDAELVGNMFTYFDLVRRKRLAMLDLLIAASRDGFMTDSDIQEEVDTFMFEGHDTTAMGLCFILALLAEHKNIQDRVRNEVNTALQENEQKFTMNLLQDLPYLDRCIKEALRLYPSVIFISRIPAEDVKLQSYLVPAGTFLHLNIYGVHRDPNFWSNPEVFDPDRFLPEKIRHRHPYSYLPFSAGPHYHMYQIVGQRFAMLEMKAMIAPLVHNFYLEPIDYLKNLRMQLDLTILSSTKHIEKSLLYDVLHPWFSTGLLTSGGAKWHSRRKILTPTFHFNILQQFIHILIEEGENMTKSLKNAGGTVVKDLVPFFSEHTLNAICETAMGTSLRGLGEQQYREAVHQMGELVVYRQWLRSDWIFLLTSKGRKQKKMLKILHGFTKQIIAERKVYHDCTNGQYLKHFDNDTSAKRNDAEPVGNVFTYFDLVRRKRLAMLDLLIAASRDGLMTDSDIREEVDTFMFEGHDTTAMGLCFITALLAEHKDIQDRVRNEVDTALQENEQKFTMNLLQNLPYLDRCIKEALRLYPSVFFISRIPAEDGHDTTAMGLCFITALLAEHKDIQDRVRNEVNTALQKNEQKFTMKLLQELPYLERCIKEALRLYPSVFAISRITGEDVKLQSYLVPAGTSLHLNIYGVHRDPNFWSNPEVFEPDRFLPEKIRHRHPYSYLPFSAGPRNCIGKLLRYEPFVGQRFAMLEMKAMIAPLVHNFYLEPIDYLKNLQPKLDLSYLVPAGTFLHLNIYGVHRDPNFWSNPEVFDPDRFLPEKIRHRHPYSYLPFSAGPRNCIGKLLRYVPNYIGQRFAVLEVKAMIAPLVHNFYLEPIDYLKNLRMQVDLSIKKGRLINLIPGPSGYPIVGNAFQCFGSREEQWKIVITLTEEFYPIAKVWGFFFPVIFISHPNDLETILSSTKHIEKSILYDILHPWFGTGLLTSGGAKWHSRRRILTPTFHFNILQQFIQILIEEGENMTKSLKNAGDTVVKDLVPFFSAHTLNAICETAMGTSLRGLGDFQQQYREAVHRMGELLIYRHAFTYFDLVRRKRLAMLDLLIAASRDGLMTDSDIREEVDTFMFEGHDTTAMGLCFILALLAEHKDIQKLPWALLYEALVISSSSIEKRFIGWANFLLIDMLTYFDLVRRKRLAMLDLLIAASRDGLMTDSDIREEVDTFMFEGHDTTAMGLCYISALLAEHKDVQDRVRNEIDSALQENGQKFTMKLLQDLPYLERCIKEALRLYPSVYVISRLPGEDVKLHSYLVPAGTYLHLNIYGVHRDPNFWSNPEVFDPDRFLPEKIRNRHPYSYLPFSAGPHYDMYQIKGQRFAMLEMKAMIAPLVHNFYLEPIDYLKNVQMQLDL